MSFRGLRGWGFALAAVSVVGASMAACDDSSGGVVVPSFVPDSGTYQAPDSGAPTSDAAVVPDATSPDADTPPSCGNGNIDPGETCDPLSSCPTDCAPVGCQLRTLENAGTCTAKCVDTKLQDACINGDGCCPPSCNANNDDDCKATCGNGAVEGNETCDPLSSCPTTCAPIGCQLRKLDGAGTCNAACVNDKMQTACVSGDQCCPAGCNANNDDDCKPGCGNNVVEPGETCDPLTTCPTTCPQLGCQLRKLDKAGTCAAQCVNAGTQTACVNGDGCCPTGCNANNDNDCKVQCDNGVIEKGETCDPLASCPTTCPQLGCQLQKLDNPGTCQAACSPAGLQTLCKDSDGCCPTGCDANNDNDCKAVCGNNVVEPGETCDPPGKCPTGCATEAYSCYTQTGSSKTCNVACHQPATCGTDEVAVKQPACCPYGKGGSCGQKEDKNCAGDGWKWVEWPVQISTNKDCTTLNLGDIFPGASYDVTTCIPPGVTPGDGNPSISDVVTKDVTGSPVTYAVKNDDCTDPTALPQLAGWSCKNKLGEKMACASPSPGGFLFNTSGASTMTFQVCGTGESPGMVSVYVWYNAPKPPTPLR